MTGTSRIEEAGLGRAPLRSGLIVVALYLCACSVLVAQEVEDPSPYSEATLIAETTTARPGDPLIVGLRIELDPGWHSYWINPGDAGQPASIEWDLPGGFGAGEIQWPYPHIIQEPSVVSYGFDNELVLLTEIVTPRFMTTGFPVKFAAEAHWLVCENICLPATANLELEIEMSEREPRIDSRWEQLFEQTRAKLPRSPDSWDIDASQDAETVALHLSPANVSELSFEGAHFFSSERGVVSHGSPQTVSVENETVRISIQKSKYLRSPLSELTGVLVLPEPVDLGNGPARALSIKTPVAAIP